MSFLRVSSNQFGEKQLETFHGLSPQMGELFTSVAEHPQRIQLTARRQGTEGLGAHRDHRDRMRVQRVGLAVVAGVEQPHPGSELGRHVHHVLAGLQQPLRQRTTGTVAALDAHTRSGQFSV